MAINRIRIGKQAELSIAPNSIVRTDINNEQEYVSPLSDNYPNRIDNIVATTTYDALNPLVGWVPPSNPILDNVTQVQFTDGTVVNYTWDGTAWVVDFVDNTSTAQRPWVKVGNTTETSGTNVLSADNIYHEGKVSVGTDQFITEYIQNINGNEYINGIQNSYFDYNRTNTFSSISVNPLTGDDSVDPSLRPSTPFASLAAAVNFINSSSVTGRNTITITGTTLATPLNTGSFDIYRGKAININANGQFINITGNISNYGVMVFNWGTYNFIGNNRIINFYTAGFYAYTPTFNLSPTHTTVHFLFRVGSTGVFDYCNINYTGNNTAFFACENNTSILLYGSTFNNGGFTGSKLANVFNTYGQSNTFNITSSTWSSLNSQAIDVTDCTIIHDNRYYHGFTTLPVYANATNQNLNVYAGNLKIHDVLKFDNNASATVDVGVVWATTATNTISLPEGVLMIKY